MRSACRSRATLMKGRSNYLCLHRWETYRDGVEGNTRPSGRLIDAGDHVLLPVIEEWAATTPTGDRAELRDLPEDLPLWKEISADADTCLGTECPRYGDCFVTLMRQRAAESDVVIVNHHLLCADAVRAAGRVRRGHPVLPDARRRRGASARRRRDAVLRRRVQQLSRGRSVRDGDAAADLLTTRRRGLDAAQTEEVGPRAHARRRSIADVLRRPVHWRGRSAGSALRNRARATTADAIAELLRGRHDAGRRARGARSDAGAARDRGERQPANAGDGTIDVDRGGRVDCSAAPASCAATCGF